MLLVASILNGFWRLVTLLKALVLPLPLHVDGGTMGVWDHIRKCQRSWFTCYHHTTINTLITLAASILNQFWSLVTLLKALVLPLSLHMDSGTIGVWDHIQKRQQSWFTCYRHRTINTLITLGASIITQFWRLVTSQKALVLPLPLHMDGRTIGVWDHIQKRQQSWFTCYCHTTIYINNTSGLNT